MQQTLQFEPAKKIVYIERDEEGIIRDFTATPASIVCPHFKELNWAYGCPFDCAYCYLKGTFYGNKQFRYKSPKHVISSLQKFFHNKKYPPTLFNSGELTDSLAYPEIMEKIVDEFEKQKKHKLLLLTKSCAIDFLLKKLRKQTIVSFSINAIPVWKKWEHKTPSPVQRIKAAKKLNEKGYEVRIRIDPIFPIDNWKEEYGRIIKLLLLSLTPSRITLGTPRGLLKTKRFIEDNSWWRLAFEKYPAENTGWGKKIYRPLRKEIYQFIIKKLRESGYKNPIALCKETPEMWREVGLDPGHNPKWEKCKCNCVL